MQPAVNQRQQLPVRGLKQVKVDNWGTFFLQRLQQLYFEEELLDLTIKFPTSDITVQAHRLVITTCTDYFVELEKKQKEQGDHFDGVLVMPPDMPYECVKSIISFMYTGQLEYWTSEQNALYRTAQKMNMTVLTKLLDAQFNTSGLQNNQSSPTSSNETQQIFIQQKQATKKTTTPTLPTQILPGRKLPIWKRNIDFRSSDGSFSKNTEVTPGPSRFDLPEVDDYALGVFSSFDDITYNTKPIVRAEDKKDSTRDSNYKSGNDHGKDASSDEDDSSPKNQNLNDDNSEDDWSGLKSILHQEGQQTPSKKVRFDMDEKENLKEKNASPDPSDALNNHAKIIREVLKKYPHLVKNNKNIRLKIMQKETNSAEPSMPAKTKVSYVVLKSDHLLSNIETEEPRNGDGCEMGPWKCNKCNLEEEYSNYNSYRRHMQDVHDEKFDPRVCEHCGYKATKRNILMYHLYMKHNVPPPKNMNFPKCHACSYVALSETLLVRHQINHNHQPSSRMFSSDVDKIQCLVCLESFKNTVALANHEIHTGHNNADVREKGHKCSHCGKCFKRLTNLQVHLKSVHKDLCTIAPGSPEPEPVPLEPSSEAEALSNVASGIAASLGVGEIHNEQQISHEGDFDEMNTYSSQEIDGQQMIMLIDNGNFPQQSMQQQVQEMEVGSDQMVMQDSNDRDMIVYIHNGEQVEQQAYAYNAIDINQGSQDGTEEIVEEVLEEVEESGQQQVIMDEDNVHQVEEVIQYVEETTEIVDYAENQQVQSNDNEMETDEQVMIIEEEQFVEEVDDKEQLSKSIANDWDEEQLGNERS